MSPPNRATNPKPNFVVEEGSKTGIVIYQQFHCPQGLQIHVFFEFAISNLSATSFDGSVGSGVRGFGFGF